VTNRQRRLNKTAPTGDTVTMATVVMTASTIVIATCANRTLFYNRKKPSKKISISEV